MMPLLFDGAFGTYYATKSRGIRVPELANIYDAQTVLQIHREYVRSGAGAIKTNTFGANSTSFPDGEQLENIIKSGYDLACQAAGTAQVFCDIGPIYGKNRSDEYLNTVKIFEKYGGSRFLFETQHEAEPLRRALEYIRANIPGACVVVSFAVFQDGFTKAGEHCVKLLDQATEMGANFVGFNCVCGPFHMLSLIKRLDVSKYNLIAMPNSGYPSGRPEQDTYKDDPQYFAEKLAEIAGCGVQMVGGCCGTTPQHIKLAALRLESGHAVLQPQKAKPVLPFDGIGFNDIDHPVVAVELSPPADTDASFVLDAAARAKRCGADVITVPDSPMGSARADSFLISAMIKQEVGIRVMPHICCRDRNRIAMKGGLIAANICGVRDILAITGDKMTESERAETKNVFNFNSYHLISYIKALNNEVFSDSPYNICAALNVSARDFAHELKRAKRKLQEGAAAFFTQPLFSQQNIDNYLEAKSVLNCRIFAGIMPPAGYKNAVFLNSEVPGIEIPAELIQDLRDKTPDQARTICVKYVCDIIDRIKDGCDGYYIMTPMKKIDYSLDIVKHIRGN